MTEEWEILEYCGPLDELLTTYPEKRVIMVPCPVCRGVEGDSWEHCEICAGAGRIQYVPEDCEVWG